MTSMTRVESVHAGTARVDAGGAPRLWFGDVIYNADWPLHHTLTHNNRKDIPSSLKKKKAPAS